MRDGKGGVGGQVETSGAGVSGEPSAVVVAGSYRLSGFNHLGGTGWLKFASTVRFLYVEKYARTMILSQSTSREPILKPLTLSPSSSHKKPTLLYSCIVLSFCGRFVSSSLSSIMQNRNKDQKVLVRQIVRAADRLASSAVLFRAGYFCSAAALHTQVGSGTPSWLHPSSSYFPSLVAYCENSHSSLVPVGCLPIQSLDLKKGCCHDWQKVRSAFPFVAFS